MTTLTDDPTPDRSTVLSIVMGTYNRCDQLERAVESVVTQTRIPFHLYITDAGSTDGTVEYLQKVRSPRITPILVGKRLGQARAYNDVFKTIESKYLCWLSDDNQIVSHGLDRAVEILESDPKIGMVALKVRDLVGPFAEAPYIGGLSAYGILNVNQGVLPTALMRKIGYFSEEFKDYGIDPDLTAKTLLSGHDIVYTRDIAIHHYRNWDTNPSSDEFAKMQKRQCAYLRRYAETYADRIPSSALWNVKRALWKILRETFRISPDSPRTLFGLNARDWQNCFAGRYISILRELRSRNPLYHLRQVADNRR